MFDAARQDAADERDEQQGVDRGEPETAEYVEQFELVHPRTQGGPRGDVVRNLALVERTLGQQRAWNCGEREEEEQHERGLHRGETTPRVASERDDSTDQRLPRQCRSRVVVIIVSCHIGSVTSEINASRTQPTNWSHAPVTRAMPTATNMIPPKI